MAETNFDALDKLFSADKNDPLNEQYTAAGVPVDMPEPEPIDKLADELGSQYWQGMSFREAMDEYDRIAGLPNAEKTLTGNLRYTDTITGQVEDVPRPSPKMWKATLTAAGQAIAAPFSENVSLGDAYETFTNPEAGVDADRLLLMGVRESAGDMRELGAAVMGNDERAEEIALNSPQVDTEDSFVDSMVADGGPAIAAAILGDKGLSKIGPAFSALTKYVPQFAKNVGRVLTGEAAAVSTIGTEEGNVVLGENAAMPLFDGLDLGDSRSDQIVEQRVNALIEGIGISSLAAGALRTTADTAGLVYDMLVRPVMGVIGPKSNKERVIFDDIANRLASITEATTEGERFQIIQSMAETINANQEVFISRLAANQQEMPVKLDTLNALIRGIDDPQMAAEARKVIAGMNTKAMPGFTAKLDAPKARMDAEIQSYLDSIDAPNPEAQTAAMQGAADDFAGQANQYLDEAAAPAAKFDADYNQALESIGSGISDDLEFAGRLKQLETVTGTDIAEAKSGKLTEIMEGVRLGYEDLSNQKNTLYNEIKGGEIDPDALFEKLFDLNDDQLSAALSQVRRSSPIKNMLDIINTKNVPDVDPDTGKEIMRPPTDEERLALFRDALTGQNADFGYIYTTIRPELSALASDLYSSNQGGAGKVVRDLVRFIDEDMVTFVENSDPDLAEAARAAKSFYKDTFAPIFSGEGVMADYADLYNRTVGRTDSTDLTAGVTGPEFDASGYNQGVENLSKGILSGGNVASADQMMQALNVASDPNAMADYMVLDVLDKYASDIRINGLDGAKLTGMSADLQRYADQLNELFPEKAAQITTFVSQIEEAARSRGNLDGVMERLDGAVKSAKEDIAETELMGFLRTELGNDEFLATTNPQAAFSQLFNKKEVLASIENINLSIASLPPERAAIVKKGLEVAYLRQFKLKTSDFRAEIGGTTPIKEVPLAKAQQEFDMLLQVGREVFADKPEVAEAIEAYSEVAGFVQANKNARTNVGLSPTAFLQEATTATNRLIFTLIGPLSRAGTRARALSGAVFQKLDPEQKAMQIYDEILSNPDKFVELAKRYNQKPTDAATKDMLSRFVMGAGLKTTAAVDEEDRPAVVDAGIDQMESLLTPIDDAADSILNYLTPEQQTEEAFQ